MRIYYSRRWHQMNFYSHKWVENNIDKYRFLHDHLKQVGVNSYKSIDNIYFKQKNNFLEKSALIIGCLHDFGKYTSYFQEYLVGGQSSKYKSHAFISSLFAAYCARKNNFPDEYIIYIYLTIKHHHGNLCNLDSDIGTSYPPNEQKIASDMAILKNQIIDIDKNKQEINLDMKGIFDLAKYAGVNLNFINEFIDNYNDIFRYIVEWNKKINFTNLDINLDFTKFLLLYSSLIDNDKRNAAALGNFNRQTINNSIIDTYRNKKFTNGTFINKIRNEMYNTIKDNTEKADLKNHFFTITSPTGSGKTIAGISASLILRKKLQSSLKTIYRIIYALPFTTIVDQNYSVMNDILTQEIGHDFINNQGRYILEHHHLSILSQKIDGTELPIDKSLMLTEDWDSEIIFTTFVQLFDALAGFKNKNLKKYFRIANSIIILDEIQSIDIEKWSNIRLLLNKYAEEFNIYFIIMTATQPKIIPSTIELSGNYRARFNQLSRVTMYIDIDSLRTPELIVDKYVNYNYKSILFMFNTIGTSISAYKHLTHNKRKLFYISSNIIPIHRKKILEAINLSLQQGENIAVISTQIFEAGVDISFDAVVRDIAPIDSLIQSSGRVNRNGNNNNGDLYVLNCSPENNGYNGYYCKQVYGKLHTDISLAILKSTKVIKEKDYLGIIKKYYDEVRKYTMDSSDSLEMALKNFMFNSKNRLDNEYYVSNFNILDNKDKYISVFVEIDDNASKIFEQYQNMERNFYNNNDVINIRQKMYEYIISVRESDIRNIICDKVYEDFYIIHRSYIKDSYDYITGIKKVDGAIEI